MLVRYRVGKTTFEVVTKEGTVQKYRKGEIKSLDDVLITDTIFTSYAKREKAGTNQLQAAFQTESYQDCVETILQKGEVQVSSAERKEKLEKRKREVINFIHKYYVDPSKKLPHPVARIENALEECKVRVDADVPVEKQIPDIISKLVNVIPLKKTTLEGQLIVPHSFIGAASSIIARYVTVERESYSSHGCTYDIGIVPGEYDLFMSEMNRVTKGNFDFHVYSQQGAAATTSSTEKTKGNKTSKAKKGNKQK